MDAERPHGLTITTYRVNPETGATTEPRTVHLAPEGPQIDRRLPLCTCPQAPGCRRRELEQAQERRTGR